MFLCFQLGKQMVERTRSRTEQTSALNLSDRMTTSPRLWVLRASSKHSELNSICFSVKLQQLLITFFLFFKNIKKYFRLQTFEQQCILNAHSLHIKGGSFISQLLGECVPFFLSVVTLLLCVHLCRTASPSCLTASWTSINRLDILYHDWIHFISSTEDVNS